MIVLRGGARSGAWSSRKPAGAGGPEMAAGHWPSERTPAAARWVGGDNSTGGAGTTP